MKTEYINRFGAKIINLISSRYSNPKTCPPYKMADEGMFTLSNFHQVIRSKIEYATTERILESMIEEGLLREVDVNEYRPLCSRCQNGMRVFQVTEIFMEIAGFEGLEFRDARKNNARKKRSKRRAKHYQQPPTTTKKHHKS